MLTNYLHDFFRALSATAKSVSFALEEGIVWFSIHFNSSFREKIILRPK